MEMINESECYQLVHLYKEYTEFLYTILSTFTCKGFFKRLVLGMQKILRITEQNSESRRFDNVKYLEGLLYGRRIKTLNLADLIFCQPALCSIITAHLRDRDWSER